MVDDNTVEIRYDWLIFDLTIEKYTSRGHWVRHRLDMAVNIFSHKKTLAVSRRDIKHIHSRKTLTLSETFFISGSVKYRIRQRFIVAQLGKYLRLISNLNERHLPQMLVRYCSSIPSQVESLSKSLYGNSLIRR